MLISMTCLLCEACLPSSHRTEREIFFVCGKADSVRKAKNGKPVIKNPQAMPVIMAYRTSKTPYQKNT